MRRAALSILLLFPAGAATQVRAARPIASPPTELAAPFSSVAKLVELADGRVLLYDSTEKRLVIVDLRSGESHDVARQGAGPLEYRGVGALFRVSGDSVLLWDPVNARRLIFTPDGSVSGSRSAWDESQRARLGRVVPREIDLGGALYGPLRDFSTGRTLVVRVRSGGSLDTLTSFTTLQLTPKRTAEGIVKVLAPGFPPVDAWGAFPDGRVLIVHGDTYTPEIVRPDGSRARANAIPYARVPITTAMRAAHLADAVKQMEAMLGRESGGRGPIPKVEAVAPDPWQAEQPAIVSPVILVDSRERAWVRVVDTDPAAGDRYDLLDAEGRRVDAVRLPPRRTLLGMGKGVLYATREDADGLVYLQRFQLP